MGAETVRLLVKNGAKVLLMDVKKEQAEEILKECGSSVAFSQCDVSSEVNTHYIYISFFIFF